MANEIRIFGPPGTGKTGKIRNEIVPKLIDKYGEEKIMLTSFTKTAAKEISNRFDHDIDSNIGTLHSICFRALGCPDMTENHMKEWKAVAPAAYTATDHYMSMYQIYRNKLIPRDKWQKDIEKFAVRWEVFKSETGSLDFVDLIETASQKFYSPPGRPRAIIVDEAQDLCKIEMNLLRSWGSQVSEFYVVGDDDQAIYLWSGASPDNMLSPSIPDSQIEVLSHSWRVPQAAHELANKIIRRVHTRQPKEYHPRKGNSGKVLNGTGTHKDPLWLIDKIKDIQKTKEIEDGKKNDIMIMVSCNYMLSDITRELRTAGIPFSNPWRKEDKVWNPLETKGSKIIKSFVNTGTDGDYWSTHQFIEWAENLKVGPSGLVRKKGNAGIKALKEHIEKDTPGLHTCREYIQELLSPDAFEAAMKRDTNWLYENMNSASQDTMWYPMNLYKKHGKEVFNSNPNVYVGTVHSFKGAAASNVFVYPDISFATIQDSNESVDSYDALCRLFYVAVTRTRNDLYLMEAGSKNFFDF